MLWFFLRSLTEALLLPIGMILLLIIVAVVLRRRWLAVVAVVLLYATATAVAARLLVAPLENAYPPISVSACPHADAVVALSGSIVRGTEPYGVQWGATASRYFAARDLARAGKADVVVFTGAGLPDGSGRTEGELLRSAAEQDGIAPERIRVTGPVRITDDEARAVAAMPGVHSVVLVTSGFHMPRAAMLFRARGLRVIPFPTDELFSGPESSVELDLLPTSENLHRSDMAIREYYGLAVYRLTLRFRKH